MPDQVALPRETSTPASREGFLDGSRAPARFGDPKEAAPFVCALVVAQGPNVPVGFKNGIWQISCKSDQFLKSDTVLRVMSAFQDAGAKCAFVHENQGKLTWYPTWAEKALSAAGLLVIFSHSYQTEFTEALMMEARLIQALFLAKRTTLMVYVPDGPNPHKPAEVASSVMKQQHGFGPIENWLAFVNANAKSADELRIADVLARVTALARPTGPTDGLEAPLALLLLEKGASLALLGSTLYAHHCRTVAATAAA